MACGFAVQIEDSYEKKHRNKFICAKLKKINKIA